MLEKTVNKLLASDSDDRRLDTPTWLLLDLLYYLLNIGFNGYASMYEICMLGLLDAFLYWTKDEKDKLRIFHSLPKVFLVHLRNPILLTLLAFGLLLLHAWQHLRANKSVVFFMAISLAVFFASFGVTKIVALSFVTGIMASYMYLWESIEPMPAKDESAAKFDQITQHNDDPHMKDQAIAQDLVSKLKRLKVAMIYEQEKIRKHAMLQAENLRQPHRRIKRTRSRSVAESKDNSDKDIEKEEDLVKKNMLELEDLKQLIEILVSHNSQEMKYWLPKDILSVLNNEEVSAYLWAYLNTQDMIPSPRAVKKLISNAKSESVNLKLGSSIGEDFNFDLFTFDKNNFHQDSLVIGCSQIFSKFKTLEHLGNIPEATMLSFLTTVQSYYFSNYYHNSIHAIDVTNSCSFFLNCGFKSIFTPLEAVTLLISATVHDVGHPGFNNAFMVAVGTSQALIYNDQSVLENYHCSLTFQIMQKEKNNILKNMTKEDKNSFRKILINNVLSTDLSKHFPIIKKFESAIEAGLNLNDEQNKHMAMAVALKCGDVGHSAKEISLHKIWSRRVTEEFWNQGDNEIELGIPITQLCDRKNNIAKSQEGFLNFMAVPLFEGFAKFLSAYIGQECFDKYNQVCVQQLKKNKEYWHLQIEKGDQGNDEFLEETEPFVKNIKLSPLPLDSLLNFPDYLQKE